MKIFFRLVGIVAGIVGGFMLGCAWSTHVFEQVSVPKQVELAFDAASDAEILAKFRLKENDQAVSDLKQRMSGATLAVAAWKDIPRLDAEHAHQRDRLLETVKTYSLSDPPTGVGSDELKAFLATVPDFPHKCQDACDRLEAQRRARLSGPTSPAQ